MIRIKKHYQTKSYKGAILVIDGKEYKFKNGNLPRIINQTVHSSIADAGEQFLKNLKP